MMDSNENTAEHTSVAAAPAARHESVDRLAAGQGAQAVGIEVGNQNQHIRPSMMIVGAFSSSWRSASLRRRWHQIIEVQGVERLEGAQ